MPKIFYEAPEGYLLMSQAALRLGVAKATFQRMVSRGLIPAHRDPKDARVRLFKVEDVERLAESGPIPEAEGGKEAA